ncbi:YqhA family protein [Algoriphagus zhangzhouensis]|uniref:Uncharacterized protein family, UPF0114 n=1 Tax=Algoriphagus zhangzhouensis TaxID=1073327 RepID=A0A1M7Z3K7_9BACT|nr:YqhA family protein [Algoriphagus zhangzhouensis]TDY48446.1 uncharacterized protein UPF0114 [Algoriphagus zhangzhouensis]SHO59493.1 Uncharacterized protein family, UPF0114 [Algoriphagus zhangzhouensis]
MKNIEDLFRIRYFALIISILILISGVFVIILGAMELFESVMIMIGIHEGVTGVALIESVDTFLFALVILILAGGIYKLFIGDENTFKNSIIFSHLTSFLELKVLLWETLLLTLTVWCSLSFFSNPNDLDYKQLIFPITIVLLAFGLKLMKGDLK